jgi:hypothetical protein
MLWSGNREGLGVAVGAVMLPQELNASRIKRCKKMENQRFIVNFQFGKGFSHFCFDGSS